jgi:arginine-tRNA-protein transferase
MGSSLTFTSPPAPCPYLPDRISQLQYELSPAIGPDDYMTKLREGWRRFGPVLFRPDCPSCRMCQSLRVPAGAFRPNVSQRRAWKRNDGAVTISSSIPSNTREKRDLLARFHQHGCDTKGWPGDETPNLDLFIANPFRTEEWSFRLGDRLVGVGYVDALPDGLSAIYFFHDPADANRSLGTYNVMAIIAAARERGLPHVYLGYYVEGCRSLEYKGRFRPNETLGTGGAWQPFRAPHSG